MRIWALVAAMACALACGSVLADERPDNLKQPPGAVPLDSQGRPDVGPVRQASRFIGSRVTAHGKELGTVTDLSLDLAEGYVALVVLQPAKESNNDRIALPPYVLKESGSDLVVSEKVTPEMIAKLGRLPAEAWQAKANRLWACQLYSQFELRAPWEDRRGGTWGAKSTYCQLYNPKQVKTYKGTIERIDYVAPQPGMALGTQVVIATDEGPRSVQLGPLWFLSRGHQAFSRGEPITVRGSEIELDGNRFIMAASIVAGENKDLKLRSPEGEVMWPDWSEADDLFSFALFSELKGTPVVNAQGKELGKIDDLAIGLESGLIAYAALDSPQTKSGEYLPVPLSAFVVKPGTRDWVLELPEDILLHTPTIQRTNWPEKIDRGWVEYVHVRYGKSPFAGVRHELHEQAQR